MFRAYVGGPPGFRRYKASSVPPTAMRWRLQESRSCPPRTAAPLVGIAAKVTHRSAWAVQQSETPGQTCDTIGFTRTVTAPQFRAVDVETANADRASICQVGIVDVLDGEVAGSWQTLVDPEDWFDPFNISIHGISEDSVRGKPTLPEIHETLCDQLTDCVVVSHTAFDRVAISRAMGRYGLALPSIRWLDSARIARRAWPERYARRGYGLQNIARDLGVEYRAHDAVEDARAAATVVIRACVTTGIEVEEWLRRVEMPVFSSTESTASLSREGNPDGPLYGEAVAFTGRLGITRHEAARLAAAAGCRVSGGVTKKTTLLIVGTQDRAALRGYEKSSKHRTAEKLIRQGSELRILSERDFRDLLIGSIDLP